MEEEFSGAEIASNLKRLSREQEALARRIDRYGIAEDVQAQGALTAETQIWLRKAAELMRKP